MAVKNTNIVGKVEDIDVVNHLEECFIDYALAVITDRAIPDVRDGLKSSQRKALFTMRKEKVTSDKKPVKQLNILGEAMKTVYVHGETSLKDAIDRLGQDWVMRECLVWGKGNIGHIDSTLSAAAPRYLEIKLTKFGDLMTELLNKDVVDMVDNYDGTVKEPAVLPSLFPNILVNPSEGIAVSMACEWLSHNLKESCDAVIAYLKNNNITYEELIKILPGPDFPLGGTIVNSNDLIDCYRTGKGRVIIRGNYTLIEKKNIKIDVPVGTDKILSFKELPYGLATDKIVDKINELIDDEKLTGIIEAYDKTELDDSDGIEQVIPEVLIFVGKGADLNNVVEQLYALTPLQSNVNFNMVGLLGKEPKLYSLKDILKDYSEHLKSVHNRNLEFDLNKEKHRLHILLGFRKALANIDEVISTIKSSKGKPDGLPKLMTLLSVDEEQAEEIWERKLGSLSNMDIEKVEKDITSAEQKVAHISNQIEHLIDYVCDSLNEIKRLSSARRTKFDNIDLSYQKAAKGKTKPEIFAEDIVVGFNKVTGIVKRGKRITGYKCSNLDTLFFFTEQGMLLRLQGHELPEKDEKLELLDMNDKIVAFEDISLNDKVYHITKNGNIKGTIGAEFINLTKKSVSAIKLKEGDSVLDVVACDDKKTKMKVITSTGSEIEFELDKIPIGGRTTSGRQKIQFDKGETISKIELS